MLNRYRDQQLISFYAQVFMCQHGNTRGGLGYWNLRLLCEGVMIDAFHWDNAGWPAREYKANDELLVVGRWTTKSKDRFQVVQSELVMRDAANDQYYSNQEQLELDLGAAPVQCK